MPKYEVIRSFNLDGEMVHRNPNTKQPPKVITLATKAAKPHLEAGDIKAVKRKR